MLSKKYEVYKMNLLADYGVLTGAITPIDDEFFNSKVIRDLDEFKKMSDIVIVNRLDDDIKDIKDKIYTRDLFVRD